MRVYNKWWKALKDPSPGKMLHPVLGEVDVVVEDVDVEFVSRVTSGVIINVTFSTTLIDPEAVAEGADVSLSLKHLARTADTRRLQASIEMPSGVLETDLFTLIAQLDGFLFSLENQALGIINKCKNVIEDMVNFIDKRDLRQTVAAARDALTSLWAALDELAQSVGKKLRPVGIIAVKNETTLDAFARDRGNTLAEVIELNPHAVLNPSVGAGSILSYYT
jgi:prophage DNA circulation protein